MSLSHPVLNLNFCNNQLFLVGSAAVALQPFRGYAAPQNSLAAHRLAPAIPSLPPRACMDALRIHREENQAARLPILLPLSVSRIYSRSRVRAADCRFGCQNLQPLPRPSSRL